MKNYLYSANGDDAIDATMEALMFPADAITGMFGTGLTTTNVSIQTTTGAENNNHQMVITHASGKNKEVINAVAKLANSKGPFTVLSEFPVGGPELFPINDLDGTILVTNIAITA
jgi:hypothetical protein